MGSIYVRAMLGIENPRVGLISNGVEDHKGNEQIHQTFELLKNTPEINFVGNMEAREMLSGEYEVLVCDGFTGNVALKSAEGTMKGFMDIFTEEISNAQQKNSGRKKSDLWTSSSVDWWQKEIEQAEKLRKIEKEVIKQSEENRKRKYAIADRSVKIKDSEEQKKSKDKKSKVQNYNDSSLVKIGGGGLTAARYDVSEKQLSETKKQSKILKQIAENTEPTKSKIELLMK